MFAMKSQAGFPRAAMYGLIHAAADYGTSLSTGVIADLQKQLADGERKVAVKDELIRELWHGLDVQQQAFANGYQSGLAAKELKVDEET